MSDPFNVVRDFEQALCDYTGAPYCVTTTSCTMALLLAVKYHMQFRQPSAQEFFGGREDRPEIEIPKRTYVGVPMSIIHAGGKPTFRDEDWTGCYQLAPLPVWDSARWFTYGLWRAVQIPHGAPWFGPGSMVCLSFHWKKTLGIEQGGAILLDDLEARDWLRQMRFDGRIQGVPAAEQKHWLVGYHAYMSPETAAAGLVRLANLPKHNDPIPNDAYPDLSTLGIFK